MAIMLSWGLKAGPPTTGNCSPGGDTRLFEMRSGFRRGHCWVPTSELEALVWLGAGQQDVTTRELGPDEFEDIHGLSLCPKKARFWMSGATP